MRPGWLRFIRDPLNLPPLLFLLLWGGVALLARPIGDFGVETDFYGDHIYSKQWGQGRPTLMNGFRGPFYYILLAGLDRLTGDAFLAAKLLSVVAAALGLRIAAGLLRRVFGFRQALVGSIVIATSPVYMEYAYRACTDHLYGLLFVASLHPLFVARRRIWPLWLAAGLAAAAAYLTRYNGIVLVPAAILAGLIRVRPLREAARGMGAFLVAFGLGIGPWCLFLWGRTGDPFWSNAFQNVAITVLAEDPSLAQNGNFMASIGLTSLREVWEVSPALFVQTMLQNSLEHVRRDAGELAGVAWAAAAVLGLILNLKAWRTRDGLTLAALGLLSFASLLPVFYNPRFMLTLLLWWGAAAGGVATLKLRGSKNAVIAASAAVGALLSFQGVGLSVDPKRHGGLPVEILDLAGKVRSLNLVFNDRTPIMARKPHIGYYLGAPVLPVPLGSIANVRAAGAHYLLVSGIEATQFHALRPMWTPRGSFDIPAGFRLLTQGRHLVSEGEARVASLYAIDSPLPREETASSPVLKPEPPPAGLSRTDHLRLKLARWYLAVDSSWDPGMMFGVMPEEAREHPLVLACRGDAALERNDLPEAERLYRKLLTLEPGNRRAMSCLAAIRRLRGDEPGFLDLVTSFAGGADSLPPGDGGAFKVFIQSRIREKDYAAALAPTSTILLRDPGNRWAGLCLAYTLNGLRRREEALAALEDYRRRFPDDPEAAALFKAVREVLDREKKAS